MVHDYTRLPSGHFLPDGRRIDRCPFCGRNGVVTDDGSAVTAVHFEYEPSPDGAAVQTPHPRKNAVCRGEKAVH